MQDPYLYSQIKTQVPVPQFPSEQEQLKCPRCDSPNTKFCYYNNYNLSQPRHFCKSCKRYWTKGGALRNIPVGGGSRKNAKRSSSSSSSSANNQQIKRLASTSSPPSNAVINNTSTELSPLKGGDSYGGQFGNLLDVSGSFSSLLGSSGGQYGNFLDGLGSHGSNLALGDHHFGHALGPQAGNSNNGDDGFLNIEDQAAESGCWSGGNGFPDLAITHQAQIFTSGKRWISSTILLGRFLV